MEFYTILIGLITIILVSSTLKLCNFFYVKKEKKQFEEALGAFNLLKKNISYNKYKKISQRKSVSNNPIRQAGGFLDFLNTIDISSRDDFIENTLSKANCGEWLDE